MQSLILIRWPDEETGGHFHVPGCLVAANTALAIFDAHVEVHLVTATEDPGEYELRYASNPIFYVGNDLPTIFYDLRHLSFAELAGKYTHSDFHSPGRSLC
ncbi:hypothetical protein [Tumebacillus lipolyticus]|uniref:Uncharacterized protein n=1 Tax=Tumebacillus lipolyticus TaxID=1280370 RepID=A0ABW4ZZD6_9BACL